MTETVNFTANGLSTASPDEGNKQENKEFSPVDVASIPGKLLELTATIAKTKKRHDDLIGGIIVERDRKTNITGTFNYDNLSDYLDRRLKKNEGIILSHVYFKKIFNADPNEMYCTMLQKALAERGLSLAPIYKRVEVNGFPTHVAFFIVIHRNQFSAMEFSDQLKNIITGQPITGNVTNLLIKGSIRVTEELGKYSKVTMDTLFRSISLLRRDEIYCISLGYFIRHFINPFDFIQFMDEKGFHVCSMLKAEDEVDSEETVEEYRKYDRLIAVAVSQSGEGIQLARDNPQKVMKICHTAEEGLPSPEAHPLSSEFAKETGYDALHS